MKWPLVTRRRHEKEVARYLAWHSDAHRAWARLFRAIAKHKQAAHSFYGDAEHDAWDRELWDAISAKIDVQR